MSRNTTTQAPQPSAAASEREALIDAMRDASNADSLALYRLANITKLAAFACESRRVLEGVENALVYDKEVRAAISQRVSAWSTWTEMEDVTGEVLQGVARQMEALNDVISGRPFDLAKRFEGADHE